MTQDHPLGQARAAGGVEHGRHVALERTLRRGGTCCALSAPRTGLMQRWATWRQRPRDRLDAFGAAANDDMAQVGTEGELGHQCLTPRGIADQQPDTAITQDMSDLRGLEQGIHRHQYALCRADSKAGRDGVELLVHEDSDPRAARQALAAQGPRPGVYGCLQIPIGPAPTVMGQSSMFGPQSIRPRRQIMQQRWRHPPLKSGTVSIWTMLMQKP